MKDLEKIKEFFLKDRAITAAYEAKEEYFKPVVRKDKSYPNFLYVDIAYPSGPGFTTALGSKTMSGQESEEGAVKALAMGNAIVKKLEAKYNIEDIEVKDLKNGKVQVFAVSDDFTKISTPSLDEAKEEDKVDTITMDVPLFIRMLEYSREDAAEDMDLHDVTEKAISLGKERGILQMDDYDEIIGTTEKVVKEEVNFLSLKDDNPFDDIPSIEIQLIDDKEGISSPKAFVNVSSMGHGGENGKMEILKNNPALQDKVMKELQIEFQKTFRRVIHSILGEPFGLDEKKVKSEKTPLEKKITEALDKINEELCPAGKAYRKRRMAAGEKSSAYLSGRAVKVCKGQMSGKKKKK
jgi:hypothetical protein